MGATLVALEGWGRNAGDSRPIAFGDREHGIQALSRSIDCSAHTTQALGMGQPRAIYGLSTAVKLVASIAIFGALALFIDFRNIGRTLFGIGALPLLACVALLILSQYLSSVRFYYLLRDHGIVVPRGD